MTHSGCRAIAVAVVVAFSLVPGYAHHGMQFLSKALEMNTAEIQLAEMASSKSQSPHVKDFAQVLIRDHNQALDEIKELRDDRLADSFSAGGQVDRTIKGAAEVQLSPEHQRILERLMALSDADFDREFIIVMIREHRAAIRDFEAQSHAHGNGTTSSTQTGSAPAPRQKPSVRDPRYSHEELARDLDTAEFANATLPTLRHHLEQAQQIQRELSAK
jgi:predicted outer membrane protein